MLSLIFTFTLSFRLDPEIIDIQRSTPFCEVFTILDGDKIKLNGFGMDIFVSIQPHFVLGTVYSIRTTKKGIKWSTDRQNHTYGERFHVSDCEITIGYEGRGGSKVVIYMMPRGICDGSYTVFTSDQRNAHIKVDQNFGSSVQNICWLMSFSNPVDFSIDLQSDSPQTSIVLGDQKTLGTEQFFRFSRSAKYQAGLNRTMFVSLNATGKVRFTADIESDSIIADWTDKPSVVIERGNSFPKLLPTYLVVERNIPIWVWCILFSLFLLIFTISACIFFGCCNKDTKEVDSKKKND